MPGKFMSEGQYSRAQALGLDVDGDTRTVELAAGAQEKIYDKALDKRKPVYVRIQNISAFPVNWSENLGKCNANQRSGIMPPDSVGGGAPNGDGGWLEFQMHRPKDIYIHCASAANLIVVLRYADEN